MKNETEAKLITNGEAVSLIVPYKEMYKCKVCGEKYLNEQNMHEHITEYHAVEPDNDHCLENYAKVPIKN